MLEEINKIIDNLDYLNSIDLNLLHKIALYACKQYYLTDNTIFTDDIYDIIINVLNENNIRVSYTDIKSKSSKIKLKYFMGSIDKIKPDSNEFNKWKNKQSNNKMEYIITDKLDGVSALLVYSNNSINLYSRGNGTMGFNINKLIKYLNIPSIENVYNYFKNKNILINDSIAFRGEIIINKNIFNDKWASSFKDSRNMISGIVNSININENVNDIELVIYEIVEPIVKPLDQYLYIKNMNFNVVDYSSMIDPSIENLIDYLKNRKNKSNYKIDGIVICSNILYNRNTDGNPDYKIALKDTNENINNITKVIKVEWNTSAKGQLIPVLILEPIEINGINIKKVTASNAKFVVDNSIGAGSVVNIIRSGDTIPYIKNVLSPSTNNKPELPMDIKWKWNDTKVNILLVDEKNSDEYSIQNIYYFFNKLNAKHLGLKHVTNIYNNNYTTIEDFIKLKHDDLINVPGYKSVLIDKLLMSIKESLIDIDIIDLIIASNKIEYGIGYKKIELIFNEYPNFIELYNSKTKNELYDMIIKINGWANKTTTKFINSFETFLNFYNNIEKYITVKNRNNIVINNSNNKNNSNKKIEICASNWRPSKDELNIMKLKNIVLVNNINNNTEVLVVKNTDGTTNKIKIAKSKNIKIIDNIEFYNTYLKQ